MLKVLNCRRTFIAFWGMTGLIVLGMTRTIDPCSHIVAIVVAIAGANAAQAVMEKK